MGQRRRNGQNKLKLKRHSDVVSANKKFTRMHAEKALARGADPSEARFTGHANYHVRAKAWRKMGMPLPEDAGERVKFLETIHVKLPVVETSEPIA